MTRSPLARPLWRLWEGLDRLDRILYNANLELFNVARLYEETDDAQAASEPGRSAANHGAKPISGSTTRSLRCSAT